MENDAGGGVRQEARCGQTTLLEGSESAGRLAAAMRSATRPQRRIRQFPGFHLQLLFESVLDATVLLQ